MVFITVQIYDIFTIPSESSSSKVSRIFFIEAVQFIKSLIYSFKNDTLLTKNARISPFEGLTNNIKTSYTIQQITEKFNIKLIQHVDRIESVLHLSTTIQEIKKNPSTWPNIYNNIETTSNHLNQGKKKKQFEWTLLKSNECVECLLFEHKQNDIFNLKYSLIKCTMCQLCFQQNKTGFAKIWFLMTFSSAR